jgi:hypothetical protein
MTPSGPVPGPVESIPAKTRKSYNIAATLPGCWEVSTVVHADQPVVVERSEYGSNRTWGHNSRGVSSLSKSWYLAEGCTAEGYETWVLVQNPNNSAAKVNLTCMTSSGPVEGPSETIEANSRKTFNIAETVPNAWEVSTQIASDKPVVAERAMYGNNRTWATDSIGVSAPANDWYLAEGATATGFETWILVQNPGDSAAEVDVTYMTGTGPVQGPRETIGAGSRKTYEVSKTVPGEWSVSTSVTSNKQVVVERSMYGSNRTWAHDSTGVNEPAENWYLAEGCTSAGFETWVLVQNPSDSEANVAFQYMTPDGDFYGPSVTLPPNSRTTVNVGQPVPGAPEVSVNVTGDKPIIVERAMYGDPG